MREEILAALGRAGKWTGFSHPRILAGGVVIVALAAIGSFTLLGHGGGPHLPRPAPVQPIAFSIPAGALPPDAPRPVVPSFDPAYAGAPSADLELVRNFKGKLSPLFRSERDCSVHPCRKRILQRDGAVVVFDGVEWVDGYVPTGRGAEVFRVRRGAAKP